MKSLYRKYRPLTLDDVVGQEQVTRPLGSSLKEGKVGHAYLFVGPRGCGKTSVARILAHAVNGFKYETEDDYVDIIEIDGASNRGIDNIRELREKVMIAPSSGKYKVYIIDEVHMLTKEAFNALLKTLEEPPEHVIFIMATTDAYKVPVTITSRAQTFTFKLADAGTMLAHVQKICEKEGIKIEPAALEVVVRRGGGSFRDTLSLLDQISTLSQDVITKDMVIAAMGLPEDEKISELLAAYAESDTQKITTILRELMSAGIKAEQIASEAIRQITDAPKPEYIDLLGKLIDVKAPFPEARLMVALIHGKAPAARNVAQPSRSVERSASASLEKPSSQQEAKDAVRFANVPAQFDFNKFLVDVRDYSAAVAAQLKGASFAVENGTIYLYVGSDFAVNFLGRDQNLQALSRLAGGKPVVIKSAKDNPNTKNDSLISKMSDIMGGEVKNDTGGNPF